MYKIFFVAILSVFLSGCGGDGMEATGLFNIKTPTPAQSINTSITETTNMPITESTEGIIISGKVFDRGTGKTITFAPIIFGGKISQADENGNYTAKNIKSGMKVIVFADGYQELETITTITDLNTKRKDFYLKKEEEKYND